MMRRNRRARGFAMLAAIAMLGIVGAILAALTGQFSYEVHRTGRAFQEAQLRQLLHAGAQDAIERARSWGDTLTAEKWTVELPSPLAPAGAQIASRLLPIDATHTDVEIEAHLDNRSATQVLHLTRSSSGWTASGAELR